MEAHKNASLPKASHGILQTLISTLCWCVWIQNGGKQLCGALTLGEWHGRKCEMPIHTGVLSIVFHGLWMLFLPLCWRLRASSYQAAALLELMFLVCIILPSVTNSNVILGIFEPHLEMGIQQAAVSLGEVWVTPDDVHTPLLAKIV